MTICIIYFVLYFYNMLSVSIGAGLSMFGCYWNDHNDTLYGKRSTTSSTVDCINLCLNDNTGYIYAGTEKVCMHLLSNYNII